MKMDLQTLCEKVERAIPTAIATPLPAQNQVIVGFTNRPDVEIALLTPYLQCKITSGKLASEDIDELLFSLRRIAETPAVETGTTKRHKTHNSPCR